MKEIIAHKGLIKSVIKKLTGSYNEDIEQEVYIKTWRHEGNYREQGKLAQWIGALTANVCRDYFKSRQYKIQTMQLNDDETLEEIVVESRQEEIIDAKMRQKIILKAVDELPRKLRDVVYRYEFEEMSYEEIARKTGVPVGTVRSRLSNARKILSKKLQFLKGEL